MKKRHRNSHQRHDISKRISKRKKKRSAGAPPHRLAQKPKLAERAAVSIENPAHSLARSPIPSSSPRFFHRFAPRISNPSQTSPAARGEPRLRLLRLLLRHEQLPRLRGHRPRQALGNPPSPSLPRSAPEGFSSTPPSRLPPWIRQDRGGPGSSARDF